MARASVIGKLARRGRRVDLASKGGVGATEFAGLAVALATASCRHSREAGSLAAMPSALDLVPVKRPRRFGAALADLALL